MNFSGHKDFHALYYSVYQKTMIKRHFHLLTSLLFIALALWVFFVPESWLPKTITHQNFYAGLLILSAILVYLPSLVFRKVQTAQKKQLVLNMQSAAAFSLLLNNGGEFGLYNLYQYGFEYDKFCHFLVPMIFSFLLAESLHAWEHISHRKIVWITLFAGFSAGIIWELFEFGSDSLFHTTLWGVYGHSVITDTIQDILFNTAGAIAGSIIFLIPSKHQIRKQKGLRN